MFLELRECKARSNSVSEGAKYLLTPASQYLPMLQTVRSHLKGSGTHLYEGSLLQS